MIFHDRPIYQEEHAAQLIMARRSNLSPIEGRIHLRRPVDPPFAFPLQSCGGPYISENYCVSSGSPNRSLTNWLPPFRIGLPLSHHPFITELLVHQISCACDRYVHQPKRAPIMSGRRTKVRSVVASRRCPSSIETMAYFRIRFSFEWTNNIFSLAIDQNLEQSGDGDGQPFDGESS